MKHTIRFSKYHGLGNDFILVDAVNQRLDDLDVHELGRRVCSRNFGIGADGLILVLPSTECDIKMQIINSDGSEPEMCGNGIRCFAKYVVEEGLIEKEMFSVETLAGKMIPAVNRNEGVVHTIEVDMGEPILSPSDIPTAGFDGDRVVDQAMSVDNTDYAVTCVSMGNPHAVVFSEDLKSIDIPKVGPLFERHEQFPNGINTEFVQVMSRQEAALIVWERGAGETLACGTGACATLVAGVLTGRLDRKAAIDLPGGRLLIEWQESDNHVVMTGPAEFVFKGEFETE